MPRSPEHRYRCLTCRQILAATTGTPFYRVQTAAETVTPLSHGCPLQAVVAPSGASAPRRVAAGLTDHRWTMAELLHSPVPLPAWVAPTRRGQPPKRLLTLPRAPAPRATPRAAA